MAAKGYFAFSKAPALLKPHHQIVKCHIQGTRWGRLTLPQKWKFYDTSVTNVDDKALIEVKLNEIKISLSFYGQKTQQKDGESKEKPGMLLFFVFLGLLSSQC